jgi:hypothetical protein
MATPVASSDTVFPSELDALQLKPQRLPSRGADIVETIEYKSLGVTDESHLLQGRSRILKFGVADAANPCNWSTVSVLQLCNQRY